MATISHEDICHICKNIQVAPITLPCGDSICSKCFEQTIDKCAYSCPFCRRRISNWLRMSIVKKADIVNKDMDREIFNKFPVLYQAIKEGREEDITDITVAEDFVSRVIAEPGEIYKEFLNQQREEEIRLKHDQEKADIESLNFIAEILSAEERAEAEATEKRLEQEKEDARLAAQMELGEVCVRRRPEPDVKDAERRPKRARKNISYKEDDSPDTSFSEELLIF